MASDSTHNPGVDDVFKKVQSLTKTEEEDGQSINEALERSQTLTEGSHDIPIELLSLSDRFIDSLSAKIYPTPPTAEKLSNLFQEFYLLAASHASTHISMLASRQYREASPSPSRSSRSSSLSQAGGRSFSKLAQDKHQKSSEGSSSEQQMLTATEIADRRRARIQLERKRRLLEEAIERRICEAVYDRIWRHRSTQDEERDEKLRSRTAALDVVGIGLSELGVEVRSGNAEQAISQQEDVREWLGTAREELLRMSDERYPLGKLFHLKRAHKGIVDTLSRLHPSSSSADEILPTLIFTLITTRPEGIDVISNLSFIQRFRGANKIDGEAAYCLTNLEAAISFLENVDVTSLKADESSTGALRPTRRPLSPTAETEITLSPDEGNVRANLSSAPVERSSNTPSDSQSLPSKPSLLQRPGPSTTTDGASSDTVLTKADRGFKTIGNTLELSYNLLFGRLKERQLSGLGVSGDSVLIVPKTLDEARKLVATPPPADQEFITSTINTQTGGAAGESNDRLLSYFGGSKMTRDKSSDSIKSGASGKRVSFADGQTISKDHQSSLATVGETMAGIPTSSANPGSSSHSSPAVESMRNFGNALNPLNRFAGMNSMLSFGRSSSSTPLPLPAPSATEKRKGVAETESAESLDMAEPGDASIKPAATRNLRTTATIAPPIRRFIEMDNPGELKINEVLELLRDYQRLAGVLRDLKLV